MKWRRRSRAGVDVSVPPPSRPGLASRFSGALARRRLAEALLVPVAVPLVAVAVIVVLAAVAAGAIIGAILVAGSDGGVDL